MNSHCRLHSSVLHAYMALRIRASSLQFRASKINIALARMDKLVKKLMSNPAYTIEGNASSMKYLCAFKLGYQIMNLFFIQSCNNTVLMNQKKTYVLWLFMFFSDDKCYQVFRIKKTWRQANAACSAISKGTLVTIQSELEQCM